MFNAGRSKQHISGAKLLSCISADVFTAASRNDIDLITSVTLLWIASSRSINLDQQRAMFENWCKAISAGRW
jgi:hypothetical protein